MLFTSNQYQLPLKVKIIVFGTVYCIICCFWLIFTKSGAHAGALHGHLARAGDLET